MNKVLYKQQGNIKKNPTVGERERQIFCPFRAFNAAARRYHNCA